jgi:hypothetical protein
VIDPANLQCSNSRAHQGGPAEVLNRLGTNTNWRRQNLRSESVASRRVNQDLPVIARFEVRYRNYVAPDGSIARPLPAFASDANLLIALYRAMVLLRLFDKKAVALQRTGRLGTCLARRRYRLG